MIVDFRCLSYDCIWRVRVKSENKVSEEYQRINVSGFKDDLRCSTFCDLRIFWALMIHYYMLVSSSAFFVVRHCFSFVT